MTRRKLFFITLAVGTVLAVTSVAAISGAGQRPPRQPFQYLSTLTPLPWEGMGTSDRFVVNEKFEILLAKLEPEIKRLGMKDNTPFSGPYAVNRHFRHYENADYRVAIDNETWKGNTLTYHLKPPVTVQIVRTELSPHRRVLNRLGITLP